MMRLKTLAAACLLVVTAAAPARAADKVSVMTSTFGFLYLTALTGVALGFYEQEGLDLEITRAAGGSKALAAVVGGDAQVYLGAPSTALRAREKGVNVGVFAACMTQYAANIVVSRKWATEKGVTATSSYEDKLKAFKGGTFAITSAGSGTDQLMRFMAKQAGISADRDMRLSGLGTAESMIAAMSQERIDGLVHSPPESNRAVTELGAVMLFNATRGEIAPLDGFLYVAMVANDEWVKSKPEVAERFMRGMQRTLDVLHDPANTTKARDATHARWHSKIDKGLYDEVWDSTLPAFPKTIVVTQDMAKRVIDFIQEFEKQPLDMVKAAGAFDSALAERAVAGIKAAR